MKSSNRGNTEIDYVELDKNLSKKFNLTQESVFVLSAGKDGKLLEFVYPLWLKGTMVPIDNRSVSGRAANTGRPYISNSVQDEREFIVLACLMNKKGDPIQKMITCPIIFADKVIDVIQIARRGLKPYESGPDFKREDVEKMKSVIDELLALHVVKTA